MQAKQGGSGCFNGGYWEGGCVCVCVCVCVRERERERERERKDERAKRFVVLQVCV